VRIAHLGRVDALGADANFGAILRGKGTALRWTLRAGSDAGIGLARVRERLALSELDVE